MLGLKKWRRNRLANRLFPDQWLAIVERNVQLYRRLPTEDKKELQRHILIFMAEKNFEGCAGLQITDEIKVTIAAQACILLLHRKTDYYPGLYSILVYPQSYLVQKPQHIVGNLLVEGPDIRLGESWHRGAVVLSWDDVRRCAADIDNGHNIVLHEFAHQLDSTGGKGDSTPVVQRRSAYMTWARILQKDYQKLRRDVNCRRNTLLDAYGATSPAEFFAVATENFFERPNELRRLHPDLYEELKHFYQQDPANL